MKLTDYEAAGKLSPMERRLVAVCQHINERPGPKRLQGLYHRAIGMRWIEYCTRNLLDLTDFHYATELRPERGVILCSNHRSFFDMYVISTVLRTRKVPWVRDMFFPVRSPFFYEQWSGLAVNLAMGGGAMYPPIFRDRAKAELNKLSVERVVSFLQQPGVVVGMHPEGTRGKGADPFDLLPAQPGVGQMALQARVDVLPIWINGLRNDIAGQFISNFRNGGRDGDRIEIVFGAPVELDDMFDQKPRATLYKRAADRILDRIRLLSDKTR